MKGQGASGRDLKLARAAGGATAFERLYRRVLPLAAAGSVALALGLAWWLRPPQPPRTQATRQAAEPPHAVVATPPPTTPAPAPAPRHRAQAAPPAGPALGEPAAAPTVRSDRSGQPAPALPQPAPASPPAPAQEAPQADTGEQHQAQDPTSATVTRIPDQTAVSTDAAATDDPDTDVPPATADSPEVREAWLRRIADLVREGRTQEARESLAEFRRRYPDAAVPPELRTLSP